MTPYRKEVDKLYNRIIKVVSKGESYLLRYFDIIDEVISYGKSNVLQDALLRCGIDTTTFKNIDDLKKNTFKKISSTLQNPTNVSLESIFKSKNVYRTGNHFYDSTTYKYLGDIEVDENPNNLIVSTFLPSRLTSAIPEFPQSSKISITYKTQSVVYFENSLYECDQQYTYFYNNRITPTFSSYWHEILPGSQSYTHLTASSDLLDKYSSAIELLRTFTYSVV